MKDPLFDDEEELGQAWPGGGGGPVLESGPEPQYLPPSEIIKYIRMPEKPTWISYDPLKGHRSGPQTL